MLKVDPDGIYSSERKNKSLLTGEKKKLQLFFILADAV